ncbi:MAG: hypothetical protein QM765_53555 [Myxococcales bacterium]
MRWLPISLVVVAAVFGTGCTSALGLAREGRWYDASRKAEFDSEAQRLVLAAALEQTDATLEFVLHEPQALAADMPYVPGRIRAGSILLASATLTRRPGGPVLDLVAQPGTTWFQEPCCAPMDWLHVDDRDDEASRIREAQARAAEQASDQATRYRGAFGGMLSAWDALKGIGAGFAADVVFLATGGAVDVDVSGNPGSLASPLQMLRFVGRAVVARPSRRAPAESAPTPAEHAAREEGLRRAEAALVLGKLLSRDDRRLYGDSCVATPEEPTSVHWWLFRTPEHPERVPVSISATFQGPPDLWRSTVSANVLLPAKPSWTAKEIALALRAAH